MKKRLLLLIFSLLLPTKINADIDRDIFKFCINKNDFDNCVEKLNKEKIKNNAEAKKIKFESEKTESDRINLEKDKQLLRKKQSMEIKSGKRVIEKSDSIKEFKDFNSEILGKEDFKNPYGDPSEWSTQEYKFWEKECRKLNMVFVEKKLLCDSLGVFNDEEYIWKQGRYRKKKKLIDK